MKINEDIKFNWFASELEEKIEKRGKEREEMRHLDARDCEFFISLQYNNL